MNAEHHHEARTSVLIVEDEGLVARDLERTLARMGYDVVASVPSCDEALRVACARPPDVVLMDIHIQGEADGVDTAELLSREYQVPVVYLTAYTDERTVGRAAKTNAYAYVVKPFSSDEVRSAIEIAVHKHRADRALARRERWFATTLRSIGDAVIACGPRRRIELMNPAAEALTGWREDEARGRDVGEVFRIVTDEALDPVGAALAERTTQSIPEKSRLLERDGLTAHVIDDKVAPIVHDDELLGAVLVFHDVTERERLREQIELTDRLTALGGVAASVAHEINNPLAFNLLNIESAIEALCRCGASADGEWKARLDGVVTMLREAKGGGDRVAKIVADLRDLSRSGQEPPRPVDVLACLGWAVRMTSNQVHHVARLRTSFGRVPRVLAREVRLCQVFVNLLTNAAQAITGSQAENEVVVTVYESAGSAVVEISDTGPGIPEEIRARIFDRFFTTKPDGVGSGLGLAICKDAVDSMGGRLEVHTETGRGTRFTVTLPAAPGEAAALSSSPVRGSSMARLAILVVDDERAIGAAMKRLLRGHDVEVCCAARDALERLQTREYDVILCDLMLPEMTGIAFYERLSVEHPSALARIAFVTGGVFTADAADFLSRTKSVVLHKPFSRDELMDAIESVRARAGAADQRTP